MQKITPGQRYEELVFDLFCSLQKKTSLLFLPPCNFNQIWTVSLEKELKSKQGKSKSSQQSQSSSKKKDSPKEIDLIGIVQKELKGQYFKNKLERLIRKRQDSKDNDFEMTNWLFGFDIKTKNDVLEIIDIDFSNFVFKADTLIFGEIKYSTGEPSDYKVQILHTAFDQSITNFLIYMNAKHYTKYLQKEFAQNFSKQAGNILNNYSSSLPTKLKNEGKLKQMNSRIQAILQYSTDLHGVFFIIFNGIFVTNEYYKEFRQYVETHLKTICPKLYEKTRTQELQLQIILITAHFSDSAFYNYQPKFDQYIKSEKSNPETEYVTKEEFNQRLDKIDDRFQQMDQKIDDRFKVVDDRFKTMEEKLDQLLSFMKK